MVVERADHMAEKPCSFVVVAAAGATESDARCTRADMTHRVVLGPPSAVRGTVPNCGNTLHDGNAPPQAEPRRPHAPDAALVVVGGAASSLCIGRGLGLSQRPVGTRRWGAV